MYFTNGCCSNDKLFLTVQNMQVIASSLLLLSIIVGSHARLQRNSKRGEMKVTNLSSSITR